MENFDAAGMNDVAVYAPVRIALLGLVRIVYGLLIGVMGGAVLWAWWAGDAKPQNPGDMPAWWMGLIGAGFAFAAFCLVSGGIGRIVSAFARGFFRAGPAGIFVRLPKIGWFGRFKTLEYRISWENVSQIVHFTHRTNLIPVATELRIELYSGGTLVIERRFFSPSAKEIQSRLLAIEAVAGR